MDPELNGYIKYLIAQENEKFIKSSNELRKKYNDDVSSIRSKNFPLRDRRLILFNLTRTYNSRINSLINIRRTSVNNIIRNTTTVPGKIYRKFAVVIGIDYLNDPKRQLKGAAMDALRMKTLLQGAGYEVTLLSDNLPNEKVIEPTLENVTVAFLNLLRNKVVGDTLFFYFSGHATYINDINLDELDGHDELITTTDIYDENTGEPNYITDDIFKSLIQQNLKTGIKMYCIIDACNSGTILDLKYNYYYGNQNLITNPKESETNGQIYLLSSARDDQLSGEALIDYGGGVKSYGGIFTYAVLDVIRSYPSNQLLSFKQLLDLVRKKIKDLGFNSQTAQLSSGKLMNAEQTYFSLYS